MCCGWRYEYFIPCALGDCWKILSRNPVYIYIYFFNKFYLFIYLFLAALHLHCCARAFSSYNERGLLFVALQGLLIAVASLVVEHGL